MRLLQNNYNFAKITAMLLQNMKISWDFILIFILLFVMSHSPTLNTIFWFKWLLLDSFFCIFHIIFVAKIMFNNISYIFERPFFLLLKYFAKSLHIMASLEKSVAILFCYVSPGYKIFKEIWLVLDESFEALKHVVAKCGQALQKMFAILFLIFLL